MTHPRAIFNFGPNCFVEAVWYVSWESTDWMAVVMKDSPTGNWRAVYRFRYYASADPFDLSDQKNAYELEPASSGTISQDDVLAKLLAAFDLMADKVTRDKAGQSWKVIVRGDAVRTLALLAAQSWGHLRFEPIGDDDEQVH